MGLLKDILPSVLSKSLLEDTSYTTHILTRLFILAHHPKLPAYQWSWVDIVRRVNVDPGELTTAHTTEFINAISQNLWPIEKVMQKKVELKCRIRISSKQRIRLVEHLVL